MLAAASLNQTLAKLLTMAGLSNGLNIPFVLQTFNSEQDILNYLVQP